MSGRAEVQLWVPPKCRVAPDTLVISATGLPAQLVNELNRVAPVPIRPTRRPRSRSCRFQLGGVHDPLPAKLVDARKCRGVRLWNRAGGSDQKRSPSSVPSPPASSQLPQLGASSSTIGRLHDVLNAYAAYVVTCRRRGGRTPRAFIGPVANNVNHLGLGSTSREVVVDGISTPGPWIVFTCPGSAAGRPSRSEGMKKSSNNPCA